MSMLTHGVVEKLVEAIAQGIVQDPAVLAAHLVLGRVGVIDVVGRIVPAMSASWPSISFSTSVITVASPQRTRWSPRTQRSPGLLTSFGGNLGCLVRIGQALDLLRAQQLVQLLGDEAGQRQVEIVELQVAELQPQKLIVPLGVLVGPVVHEAVGFGLGRGKPLRNVDRDRLQAQRLAASSRVWPTITTIFSSTTMGWRKPNSAIDAFTASMAAVLLRGFRA